MKRAPISQWVADYYANLSPHDTSGHEFADEQERAEKANQCPCDREKRVDPLCAALGMCAREEDE